MPRKDGQPRDPHTGQWAKEYVFDLDDTKIPARPERADVRRYFQKTFDRDKKGKDKNAT
jgi:hypothetical protein